MKTWMIKVPIQIPIKIGFRKIPLKTFRSPWIFREFISLNKAIKTKVLKTIVKCCVRAPWSFLFFSSVEQNNFSPEKIKKSFHLIRKRKTWKALKMFFFLPNSIFISASLIRGTFYAYHHLEWTLNFKFLFI